MVSYPKESPPANACHPVEIPTHGSGHDVSQGPLKNLLLASLTRAEFEHIEPFLEWVEMPQGELLFESGSRQDHVYFPTTAVVSLHYLTQNGSSAEVAEVGREGVIGISLFMGVNTTLIRASVILGGYGYRLKAVKLAQELERGGGRRGGVLQQLLLRYTQALMTQVAQTAVCNRHHSVEQQLCRWLLLACDRSPTQELAVTHELIASMLGVRREGITGALGHLQDCGYLICRRGHITVLNRAGLEREVCECYPVLRRELDRLLNPNDPFRAPGSALSNLGAIPKKSLM